MRKYTSAHLYQQIREDFMCGAYTYGETITEIGLSERYTTSRTPLREALIQLEKDGLVERQSNGRINILRLDVPKLEEILHLRLFLESLTLEYALKEDRREACLHDLRENLKLVDEHLASDNRVAARAALARFHEITYEYADLTYTTQIIKNYNFLIYPLRSESLLNTTRLTEAQREHKHMFELIEMGKLEEVHEFNRHHLMTASQKMIDRLRELTEA